MDFNELENYLGSLPDKILDDAAEIVAETATAYYKETFRRKAFDGNPWAPAKVPRQNGSLLIDSGNLLNSIRPAYVGRDKVVISAGNDKVDYAKVHNEGFIGRVCSLTCTFPYREVWRTWAGTVTRPMNPSLCTLA